MMERQSYVIAVTRGQRHLHLLRHRQRTLLSAEITECCRQTNSSATLFNQKEIRARL